MKILKGKSLQSDLVQGHKLSHNIVNFRTQYRNVHCLRFPNLEQLNSCAERDSFCLPKLTQVPRKNI